MNVAKLIERQFGIVTRVNQNPDAISIGTDVEQIMPNNPNRLGYTVVNLSANSVYIAYDRGVGATHGILLTANGGSVSSIFQEDFEACCWSVFAVASGAASDIYVLEVLIDRVKGSEVLP